MFDHGDVSIEGLSIEDATPLIRDKVAASVEAHALTLLVGGNNAVTRPGVLGLGLPLSKVGLITLDAHFDMRDLDSGLSNGNPVRALTGDGLPGANIAQVGLASGDERVACVIPALPADPQQLPIVVPQQGAQAQALEAREVDADEAGTARDADELTVRAAIAEQTALAVATKETAAAVAAACEGHSGSHHKHAANKDSDGPTAYFHLRSPFGSSYMHLVNIVRRITCQCPK